MIFGNLTSDVGAFSGAALDVLVRDPEPMPAPRLCENCTARKVQIVDLLAVLAELRLSDMALASLRHQLGVMERTVESCPGPRGGAR